MAKKQKVVITRHLFWPTNPLFTLFFVTLAGYGIYRMERYLTVEVKLILSTCGLMSYYWTRSIMRNDIEKAIGNQGTWYIDIQNILITTLLGVAVYIVLRNAQETVSGVLHVSSALVAMLITIGSSLYLTINILKMNRVLYQPTTICMLILSVVFLYDPYFSWRYYLDHKYIFDFIGFDRG